ncbi:MAG: DUF4129 domain-containing protein [Dehalococcoidales bacterium]|nr:DUF4129 domain-containing protein [Dehalococcoidales bacterium]
MTKRFAVALILVLVLLVPAAQPALAHNPRHEDPEASSPVFSGIDLLWFYSSSLDLVLEGDGPAAEALLEKMPFLNIPPDLEGPAGDFSASCVSLSHSLSGLFALWEQEHDLLRQYRLAEAVQVRRQIIDDLTALQAEMERLQGVVDASGDYLQIDRLAPGNILAGAFSEVQEKVLRLRETVDVMSLPMLDLETVSGLLDTAGPGLRQAILDSAALEQMAELLGITVEEMVEMLDRSRAGELFDRLSEVDPEALQDWVLSDFPSVWQQLFQTVTLTLEVSPRTVFVGEEAGFSGRLTSDTGPLGDREVEILFDRTRHLKVRTDSSGFYQGRLQVPFRYQDEMEVQAVYYPAGGDVGTYLGTTSSPARLSIQYYEADLTLQVTGPAYPGRSAVLTGSFDYGEAPSLEQRPAELYLDDRPLARFSARRDFRQEIELPPEIIPGRYNIAMMVPAESRYAPLTAACSLEVSLAPLSLDFNAPRTAFIPGEIALSGRVFSMLGPASGAVVRVEASGDSVSGVTDTDGFFTIRLKMGTGLDLLGSQPLTLQVQPQESWNAPAAADRTFFAVNVVNCAILLVVLGFFGFYLPWWFRKWSELHAARKAAPAPPHPAVPVISPSLPSSDKSAAVEETADSPGAVLKWYLRTLQLVQRLTRAVLLPQQTLREYSRETGPKMGPLGRYFAEFTLLVERFLYSAHKPAPEEIEKGRRLAESIETEAGNEDL